MPKTVLFHVGMTCGGCEAAVKRILGKKEGVNNIDVNLETKEVTVTCDDSVDPEDLHNALKNWATAANKTLELKSVN